MAITNAQQYKQILQKEREEKAFGGVMGKDGRRAYVGGSYGGGYGEKGKGLGGYQGRGDPSTGGVAGGKGTGPGGQGGGGGGSKGPTTTEEQKKLFKDLQEQDKKVTKEMFDKGQSNYQEQFNDIVTGSRPMSLSQKNKIAYQNRIYNAWPSTSRFYVLVREFVSGDPVRLISWSASARSDSLMVRDMEPPEPERFVVVYHSCKFKSFLPDRKQFEKCLRILSGLFVLLQENNRGFEFFSSLSDWQPVVCDNPAEIPANALSLLASANFGEPDQFGSVKEILNDIPSHYHCVIVSAAPLKSWLDRLPNTSCSLTCVDSKSTVNVGGVMV